MLPIPSMYDIFTYIFHKNQSNVGKYTIHGWYGLVYQKGKTSLLLQGGLLEYLGAPPFSPTWLRSFREIW